MTTANDNRRGWPKRSWLLAGILVGMWVGAGIVMVGG